MTKYQVLADNNSGLTTDDIDAPAWWDTFGAAAIGTVNVWNRPDGGDLGVRREYRGYEPRAGELVTEVIAA